MKSEALECLNDVPAEKLAELRAKTNRELAEYVRSKLNLAVQLACKAERERRAGRRESAKQCQCLWEGVTAEVKRLLPMVRAIGVRLFAPEKPEQHCPRPKRR
jgi:hypothetical protein